jgi:hypothetical protein
MLLHTFVTTMLDAGVSLRDVQIAARHADPRTTIRYDRARKTSTATPTTSSPPSWPPERDQQSGSPHSFGSDESASDHGAAAIIDWQVTWLSPGLPSRSFRAMNGTN